jgi:hypothetical protein
LAAWKIAARTNDDETVLILDYEGHPGEWRSRLEDFGADMTKVYLALPIGVQGGLLKGAIWDQADAIRDEADRIGADWLYVDTVSAACGVHDITDSTAPGPYFAALNAIGRASVSIGHVTKAEQLEYPFGSMLWRAYIRMGWSLSGEGALPHSLVNRKTNDYPSQPSVTLDWSWTARRGPRSVPPSLTVAEGVTVNTTSHEDHLAALELRARETVLRLAPTEDEAITKTNTAKAMKGNYNDARAAVDRAALHGLFVKTKSDRYWAGSSDSSASSAAF